MLRHTTYQSIYNNDFIETASSGLKTAERFQAIQAMFSRRLLFKLLLTAVIIIAGCTGMVRVFAGSPHDEIPMEQVVVSQGDTLWGIAVEYKPKDMDTRAFIRVIKETNHLKTSGIEAGDVLSLPLY
ncbi:LysM peptidoglycan-binding domain-containing protein [Paenibacillus dokdonensis]|uniref:LysM peptidoglycan-binding domain-containing protein n=1 Tax=Paenibacillus dokdonensis TaxID=2567944 RepID=A0ABU6GJF1_9BACL|nr:LysM peptidoglycan-binding domain-containing protein [Paenibacillus dokdonensis]MEC0239519.1 LysM peptidoglycan-binding domain-containing protein [Paenibacillus dokdonensis]